MVKEKLRRILNGEDDDDDDGELEPAVGMELEEGAAGAGAARQGEGEGEGEGARGRGREEGEGREPHQEMCVECQDQPSHKACRECEEDFCEVCYHAIHRSGSRKNHHAVDLRPKEEPGKRKTPQNEGPYDGKQEDRRAFKPGQAQEGTEDMEEGEEEDEDEEGSGSDGEGGQDGGPARFSEGYFVERAKSIPLRLSEEERRKLQLLEAALNVSEYTDKVDILSYGSKAKRIEKHIRDLCSILCGLVVASDIKASQAMLSAEDFEDFPAFFQEVFEIGRRYKIMNPEKMRTDYGKLIYLLQDSQFSEVERLLGFNPVVPVKTVYSFLKKRGGLELLRDPLLRWATLDISGEGVLPGRVQRLVAKKERALREVAQRHARGQDLTEEEIRNCLNSIADNHSFLRTSRDTIQKTIDHLRRHFDPERPEQGHSLAIRYGVGGARLTHSHSHQFTYVLQSLTLWRSISHDMFKLWLLAEEDLLTESYHLRDTGQGLNRVQRAPRIGREMQNLLYGTQKKAGDWVGSSVVHLGDHNVPNAFVFIDKYTQVPRILNPLVSTLGKIDALVKNDPHMELYVNNAFGGKEALKKEILGDFFRHGFDGSGADNFFDAGSCIDGRLTSAWNWCSKIEKKRYFPIFLLTDFIGFDGKF